MGWPKVSHRQLTNVQNLLVAEASDLGLPPGWRLGRIIIATPVRDLSYEVHHVHRDGEGELLWWDLHPTDEMVRGTVPDVRIYND